MSHRYRERERMLRWFDRHKDFEMREFAQAFDLPYQLASREILPMFCRDGVLAAQRIFGLACYRLTERVREELEWRREERRWWNAAKHAAFWLNAVEPPQLYDCPIL